MENLGLTMNFINEETELSKQLSSIEYDNDEDNILLLTMSTLPNSISLSTYLFQDKDDTYTGHYVGQLEPMPKILAKILSKENKRLSKIFVLTSIETKEVLDDKTLTKLLPFADHKDKTYSAFTYFQERCACLFNGDTSRIIDIPLEEKLEENHNRDILESALDKFIKQCDSLKTNNIYIDMHGGMRINQIPVDAISMLINNSNNLKLKDVYSMLSQDKTNHIYTFGSVRHKLDVLDFVAGMREFTAFGQSQRLSQFNNNPRNNKLIQCINKVADSLQLCRMTEMERNLDELNLSIKERNANNGEIDYFDIVISNIKDDYKVTCNNHKYNLLDKDERNFLAELQWCINKGFVQQALTLVESKTASYLNEINVLDMSVFSKTTDKTIYDNWINNSLLAPYDSDNTDISKEFYLSADDHKKLFREIKITNSNLSDNNIEEIIEILKNRHNPINLKEYYETAVGGKSKSKVSYENREDGSEYLHVVNAVNYKSLRGGSENIKRVCGLYCRRELVPVNESLRNDEFLSLFYVLLTISKYLKLVRNDTNHSNGDEEFSFLTKDMILGWIRIYLYVLTEITNLAKNINKPISIEKIEIKPVKEEIQMVDITNKKQATDDQLNALALKFAKYPNRKSNKR